MTQEEGLAVYLSKSPAARGIVQRLMDWDEKENIKINAFRLFKNNLGVARQFKIRYGLRCVTLKSNFPSSGKQTCTEAYVILRKAGWTFDKIALAFKRTRQTIEQGLSRRDLIR